MLNEDGYAIEKDESGVVRRVVENNVPKWYPAGLPVWEYDLYFAKSRHYYSTEYVRARDNRQAKRKIKKMYSKTTSYEWNDGYAD